MVRARGEGGEIRWRYFPAAAVASWEISAADAGSSLLVAALRDADTYRLAQQPLRFVVDRPQGHRWAWPIATLTVDGLRVTATLGPAEE